MKSNIRGQKLWQFGSRKNLFKRDTNLFPSKDCGPTGVSAPGLVCISPKGGHPVDVRSFEQFVKRVIGLFEGVQIIPLSSVIYITLVDNNEI